MSLIAATGPHTTALPSTVNTIAAIHYSHVIYTYICISTSIIIIIVYNPHSSIISI